MEYIVFQDAGHQCIGGIKRGSGVGEGTGRQPQEENLNVTPLWQPQTRGSAGP